MERHAAFRVTNTSDRARLQLLQQTTTDERRLIMSSPVRPTYAAAQAQAALVGK